MLAGAEVKSVSESPQIFYPEIEKTNRCFSI